MSNEQMFKLELSITHVNTILSALAKLPLEQVLEAFNAIQQQAGQQVQAAQAANPPPSEPVYGTADALNGE